MRTNFYTGLCLDVEAFLDECAISINGFAAEWAGKIGKTLSGILFWDIESLG